MTVMIKQCTCVVGTAARLPSRRFSSAVAGTDLVQHKNGTRPNVIVIKSSGKSRLKDGSFAVGALSATDLVDQLLERTSTLLDPKASNSVAFSGGVDSSLAAALVYRVFSRHEGTCTSNNRGGVGNALAVLGLSPAVPEEQVDVARRVADIIGIDLMEVNTDEGKDPTYIANAGEACFACKTRLYTALEAVAEAALAESVRSAPSSPNRRGVIMYNGTNADDTRDPTRLGLVAASNFRVESPLLHTTKADVRRAARHLGLPNWDHAAAPCLRSRLAFGVEAKEQHLRMVGEAERRVRLALGLDHTVNMRVRMLAKKRAMVELDQLELVERDAPAVLRKEGFLQVFQDLGFDSFGVRAFKTGSVAAVAKDSSVGTKTTL